MAGQEKDVHTVALGDGWVNKIAGAQVGAIHRTQETLLKLVAY